MRRHNRPIVVAALCAAALVTAACSPAGPRDPVPSSQTPAPTPSASIEAPVGWWRPTGAANTLASGLRAPWSVVAVDGGALISERDSGLVRELTADGSLRDAGVVPGVVSGGESGLHGLALRTDERTGQDWLYAYHGAASDNRVIRMPLLGEPGALRLGDPDPVFTGIPRASTHNGGRIAFGPDGFLYVSTGDAQNRDASQDPRALGGKILRLTPDGEAAPGNPFGTEIWSLGHRNVQGLAWTADGALWASEFGQNAQDELNRIVAGANYGWPIVEGVAGDDRFEDPVASWPTSEASPSGIAAVGSTIFMAGLRGERLWAIDVTDDHSAADIVVGFQGQGRLRDVLAAPGGTLWVLTNNTDGRGAPRDGDDVLIRIPVSPRA